MEHKLIRLRARAFSRDFEPSLVRRVHELRKLKCLEFSQHRLPLLLVEKFSRFLSKAIVTYIPGHRAIIDWSVLVWWHLRACAAIAA